MVLAVLAADGEPLPLLLILMLLMPIPLLLIPVTLLKFAATVPSFGLVLATLLWFWYTWASDFGLILRPSGSIWARAHLEPNLQLPF